MSAKARWITGNYGNLRESTGNYGNSREIYGNLREFTGNYGLRVIGVTRLIGVIDIIFGSESLVRFANQTCECGSTLDYGKLREFTGNYGNLREIYGN